MWGDFHRWRSNSPPVPPSLWGGSLEKCGFSVGSLIGPEYAFSKAQAQIEKESEVAGLEKMTAWVGEETSVILECRRRHLRLPLDLPVTFERIDGSSHIQGGTIENLSDGGLMLRAAEPLLPGSSLALSVVSSDGKVSLEGKVVWSRRIGPDQAQIGILLEPSPGQGFARQLFIQEFARMQ